LFTFTAIFLCGARLIHGLGSGSKGQDAAFIVLVVTGSLATALATAPTGAMILAATKPAFANWFQAHKILGSILTAAAVVPIAFAMGITVTVVGAILLGTYVEFFKR
jgi:hypothetical protein